MNSGLYTAYSGLRANADMLQVLGNNLANIETTAFKADTAFFRVYNHALAQSTNAPLDRAINDSTVVHGSIIDFSPGPTLPTGRDLDVALEKPGFFVVQTEAGPRYTRNGHWQINGQGHLVTSDGLRVLGKEGPITLPPGSVSISQRGAVEVQGALVDSLKVVDFSDKSQLEKVGASLFQPKKSTVVPEEVENTQVRQGVLERSNVNPVRQMMLMINIMRQFEGLQRNVNMLMHNLNERSINQLGRAAV